MAATALAAVYWHWLLKKKDSRAGAKQMRVVYLPLCS
jgi:hypothetical protein